MKRVYMTIVGLLALFLLIGCPSDGESESDVDEGFTW